MAFNVEALKVKVRKAIERFPAKVEIFRDKLDTRRQPSGESELITKITGQYYKGRSFIVINIEDKGKVKSQNTERFMTIIDEDSLNVQEGDWFTYCGVKYKIADLGNTLDVYFDFCLERM